MGHARLRLLLAGVVVFLLNPTFACVSEPEFQYGEEEMRDAIEGTWDATLTFQDGSQKTVTFSLQQGTSATASAQRSGPARARTFVRPAAACTGRTFVRGAAACSSTTTMPLTGAFVSGDEAYRTVAITGELKIPGLTFDQHSLLKIDLGDQSLASQNLTKDGTVSTVTVSQRGGGALGTATLVRRPMP